MVKCVGGDIKPLCRKEFEIGERCGRVDVRVYRCLLIYGCGRSLIGGSVRRRRKVSSARPLVLCLLVTGTTKAVVEALGRGLGYGCLICQGPAEQNRKKIKMKINREKEGK